MTPASPKLMPCPWCSAPAHIEEDSPPRAGFKIHAACGPDCKAQPSLWAEYADDAIEAWNRRSVPSPAVPEGLDADWLRETLKYLREKIVAAPDLTWGYDSDGDAEVPRGLRSWPVKDEILHNINKAISSLAAAPQSTDTGARNKRDPATCPHDGYALHVKEHGAWYCDDCGKNLMLTAPPTGADETGKGETK